MDRIRCDCAVGFIFDKIGYTEGMRILFRRSSATLLATMAWKVEGDTVE